MTKRCESSANKLDSKKIVVSAGTILINIKKIKIRSGLSIKNGVKCTSTNGVKHFFTDGEKVSFTSSRHSILMSVYEFCDHIHFPVKAEVYMIDGKEEAISLQDRSIVTFLGCREETSLVIKVERKGESEGLIYSIPVDWDIEVCIHVYSSACGGMYTCVLKCLWRYVSCVLKCLWRYVGLCTQMLVELCILILCTRVLVEVRMCTQVLVEVYQFVYSSDCVVRGRYIQVRTRC